MESEEDSKLPVWIADRRERECVVVCLLPLCTCRKPTHTDTDFKSHHPNHVKRNSEMLVSES